MSWRFSVPRDLEVRMAAMGLTADDFRAPQWTWRKLAYAWAVTEPGQRERMAQAVLERTLYQQVEEKEVAVITAYTPPMETDPDLVEAAWAKHDAERRGAT